MTTPPKPPDRWPMWKVVTLGTVLSLAILVTVVGGCLLAFR